MITLQTELKLRFVYGPADYKNSNALNEITVRHYTTRLRSSMLETSLPVCYAQEAGDVVVAVG